MEEKEKIKISLKTAIIIILVIAILVGVCVGCITYKLTSEKIQEDKKGYSKEEENLSNVKKKKYKGNEYYIIEDDYSGEYDLQYISLSKYFNTSSLNRNMYEEELDAFQKREVISYSKYKSYCDKWDLEQKYKDSSSNYIVFSYYAYGRPILNARLANVEFENQDANLYIWDSSDGVTADISAYVLIIPTDREIEEINIVPCFTEEEFLNIKKYDSTYDPIYPPATLAKPIIYLYPEEEMELTVKLGNSENITCSYPEYPENGWKVIASPNGDLEYIENGKYLYSLYYEAKNQKEFDVRKDGFVVAKEDVAEFLEEKLALLGLTPREAEEFIVYWLPRLQENDYNYIRFASQEEIEESMPLEISKTPDSLIRVLMVFKGLDEPIEVEEQELKTPERTGFVAVEWGGTEILDKKRE